MSDETHTINPTTGEPLQPMTRDRQESLPGAIDRADQRFRQWRAEPIENRAAVLAAVGEQLDLCRDELARLMAEEMGKPVSQGRSEIEKCAWACRFYAEHGAGFLERRDISTDKGSSYVAAVPLGVILAIMPWNFPFWQVFRCVAPNLMAGNTMLLKHASNVPRCALAIAGVLQAAGAPADWLQCLMIPGDQVESVIRHPLVRGVSFTGSTTAGKKVATAAGAAMKKGVFELGGSDPYIVFEDADIEHAAEVCATSRMVNGGQSCIAAKRFVVIESVRERFEKELVARMGEVKMGDPLDDDTELGPMARFDLRDELHRQVVESVEKGARLVIGGEIPSQSPFHRGAYYPPTVLTEVGPKMPAYQEETFGPVAAVIPAADRDEAIRIANDTCFGLGAALFTGDVAEGERIARDELEAGTCVVNGMVASDPRLPFGGIKDSGTGRELSAEGIREFVNLKTVVVSGG